MKLLLIGGPSRKKPPGALRTLPEMAAEFGVTIHQLVSAFKHHPEGAPKPWSTHRNLTNQVTYYVASQVRAWWRATHEETADV